ncbi:hypothetical protein BGZ47_009741 [Haplosporangium gracile]|nr:hypothetical protein BGZ47_009741 [Haplosporangium gracile]
MVTFNVVRYPSASSGIFSVSIGGTVHRLAATEDAFPSTLVPSPVSRIMSSTPPDNRLGPPKIPYAYMVHYLSKSKGFKHKQIETIHAIYSQTNITPKTAGKSSKEHQEQSFKFKFHYNQTFFHRPNIKLRSMAMDPTMKREKLYIDMLNSAGIPTQQGAWIRLFVR